MVSYPMRGLLDGKISEAHVQSSSKSMKTTKIKKRIGRAQKSAGNP